MMGFWFWFRVAMMSISLVAVIVVMRRMNQTPVRFAGGSQAHYASALMVNMCPTRVTKLEAGRMAVFEEGMNWFRAQVRPDGSVENREALDPVSVEKWFSRNCTLVGRKVSPSPNAKDALKVHFVSGEPRTLRQSAGGDFEWLGLPFSSAQLADALRELGELPTRSRTDKPKR